MKNYNIQKSAILVLVVLFVAQFLPAQSLRTGYFVDGSMFNYRINPAYNCQRGHVSVPFLGSFSANMMGNVGFESFFFESPVDKDRFVMFFDESVSADKFLKGLEGDNTMRMDVDLSILSFGFHGLGGFNTIDLSFRSNMAVNLPYTLLDFMKNANTFNGSYEISDLHMQTRNFIDLSLGHSHKIGDNLSVGARAKLLFGLGHGNVEFDKMNMSIERVENNIDIPGFDSDLPIGVLDRWSIEAHGEANVALGGEFKISDKKTINGKQSVVGYDDVELGLQGFGLGVDFGAIYEFDGVLDGLALSASVNDLGFINWKDNRRAEISGDKYYFDGFDIMGAMTGTASVSDQLDDLGKDLEDFFALEDKGEESYSSGIGAKVNLGVEYALPFYKKVSAGVLYTHCFDDFYSYDQTSLVLSYSPNRVLDFAASSTFTNFGTSFGALANIHCKGFGLFIGTDCFVGDLSDHYIPNENMNFNITFGLNIALGCADED